MIELIVGFFKSIIDYLILTFGESGAVQIISSIIVFTSAVIAFISTRRKTAIDIITKNRIDWTNKIRERASKIVFLASKMANNSDYMKVYELLSGEDYYDNFEEISSELDDIYNMNASIKEFRLYFNPFEKDLGVLFGILNELDNELGKSHKVVNIKVIDNLIKDFITELSIILKFEWERIKKEAGINKSIYKKTIDARKYIMSLLNK